jgi:calcineurin-like phosphoesterase family protein
MDRDWLGSITGSNDMAKTKPFTNMFGSEVQVTRTEFIVRWQDKLWDLGDLFMGTEYEEEFLSVVHHTHDLAGKKWDSK